MVELRMLGEIRVIAEDGADVDALLRQPKRLALLAYLASPSPGTWQRRDMLLALFWPELDTAHARTSLRNGLYVLRQTLGDRILRTRGDEEISIDPGQLQTDLARVWDALRRGDADEALSHYGGDLLPGLFPPDSEGFQRWLDSERTRLKVSVSRAAMSRVDDLVREGNVAHALNITRRVCEINPDDETVVRRLMTLHEAIGDRAGGLAVFESYRARLASDFDADPAPETVEAANRLRASTAGLSLGRAASMTRPVASRTLPEEAENGDALTVRENPKRSRRAAAISVAALSIVVAAGAVASRMYEREYPASIGRSSPVTLDEGLQVEAAISPNGRLVAYAKGNPNHVRIFVQRVEGGAAWPLSTDSTNVELMPRWSPDNDAILFLSRNNAYIAPTLGGTAGLVARGSDGDGMIRSASFSPTGDSIAVVRNDSLFVRPLRGGGMRVIGRGFQLHSCVWSPAGTWIACVSGNWIAFTPGPLFGNNAPSVVMLFPLNGGEPVTVTSKDHESENPAWSADGKFLWFLSNRDGSAGEAYAVKIGSDGRASNFQRIGINAESISLSSRRIAYSVPIKKANIWSIPIIRNKITGMTAATQLTTGSQVIELVSVSRDGRWLMYDSNLRGNSDIYRMSLNGGTVEALTDDPRQEFAAELSPSATEFAWHRWVNGRRRLVVKRLDSDSVIEIFPEPGDQGVPRWSPDGSTLVAWSHDNERGAIFVLDRDNAGRWSRPGWRLDFGQLPIWSPDGSEIAFVRLDGRVQSIPRDSGAVRTLYTPRPGTADPQATYLVWSKDPEIMWMIGTTPAGQGIFELSLKTGKPRQLVLLDDPVGKSIGPAFSADSSRFYFAINERFSNVRWAELVSH